jgi:Animal haem peroxidase
MSHHPHDHQHHAKDQLEFRTIDGTGNNKVVPDLNATGTAMARIGDAHFVNDDGHTPILDGPNPRDISNIVVDQTPDNDVPNPQGGSGFMYVWGQFTDHDLDRMDQSKNPADAINVTAPQDDPDFPGATIPVSRVITDPSTGTAAHPAAAINNITGWLDGSQVYGSDAATAASLRLADGHLKESPGGNLPIGPDGIFMAGDVRVAENPDLTAIHDLFVREHNFQVDLLQQQHPHWTGDQLYEQAKAITTAEMVNITYNEYLPHLIGDVIPDYQGYDPNVDARITEEFAGAAYRFGHSIVSDELGQINEQGVETGNQKLQAAFFEPAAQYIASGNGEPTTDSLLRALASDQHPAMDAHIVDALRNFLSDPPDAIDLAATNIQRGHDLGLGTLNETRVALGLDAYTDFNQITTDVNTQMALSTAFGSDVNKVDLWTGGLSEDSAPGALVGTTFQQIIGDQFTALRDGDRFYFENQGFDPKTLQTIKDTTLSDIMVRNTSIDHLQADAFVATVRHTGVAGVNPESENPDLPQLVIGTPGVKDTLIGGPQGDTLVAAVGGKQTLVGEGGADTFVIPKGARTKIADFQKGVDQVQFEGKQKQMDHHEQPQVADYQDHHYDHGMDETALLGGTHYYHHHDVG